ncbi:MAG: SRPBCC family protein [Myxococcota bacterium]
MTRPIDPKLDLVLERSLDVPPALLWECWTSEEHVPHWFVPKPWTITACKIDLRLGGAFNTTMRSPEGQEFPNSGCFLEIVEGRRLVWTDALLPGWRPAPKPFFTAVLEFEPVGSGSRYTAIAMHGDPDSRKKHEEMGFADGWGTVVDQLVAYIHERGLTAR